MRVFLLTALPALLIGCGSSRHLRPECVATQSRVVAEEGGNVDAGRTLIEGAVADCTGHALQNVTVLAEARHFAGWIAATTDQNGRFSLLLPSGPDGWFQLSYYKECGEAVSTRKGSKPCGRTASPLLKQRLDASAGTVAAVKVQLPVRR